MYTDTDFKPPLQQIVPICSVWQNISPKKKTKYNNQINVQVVAAAITAIVVTPPKYVVRDVAAELLLLVLADWLVLSVTIAAIIVITTSITALYIEAVEAATLAIASVTAVVVTV